MRSFIPKYIAIALVFLFFLTLDPCPLPLLYADTIRLKSGKEIRGIIVEDYVNRVVISTPDGEQTIAKRQIDAVRYDSEEDNLIKLAERARARRDYSVAYAYYERALTLNPDSKAAQDGITIIRAALLQQDEARKMDDIKRRQAFEASGSPLGTVKPSRRDSVELEKDLERTLGMSLKTEKGFPRVETIRPGGPAAVAGLQVGDTIVAVWSRLTGYMQLSDVIKLLLDKRSLEIKVAVDRTVPVRIEGRRWFFANLPSLINASFSMEFDGMTVAKVSKDGSAAKAGLQAGDLVTAINGESTRYMPLGKAADMIKKVDGNTVDITIRREFIIWRRGA